MKHTVEMLPRAIAELRSIVLWWAEHRSTEQAGRWMIEMEAASLAFRIIRNGIHSRLRATGFHSTYVKCTLG